MAWSEKGLTCVKTTFFFPFSLACPHPPLLSVGTGFSEKKAQLTQAYDCNG